MFVLYSFGSMFEGPCLLLLFCSFSKDDLYNYLMILPACLNSGLFVEWSPRNSLLISIDRWPVSISLFWVIISVYVLCYYSSILSAYSCIFLLS